MGCEILDFSIPFDEEDRLKRIINRRAGGDAHLAEVYCALMSKDEFVDYCKNLSKYDTNKSFAQQNLNFIEHAFIRFVNNWTNDINTTRAKKQIEELQGYSSATAKAEAEAYAAGELSVYHYNTLLKQNKLNKVEVLSGFVGKIQSRFINEYFNPLLNKLNNGNELRQEINDKKSIYDSYRKEINSAKARIETVKKGIRDIQIKSKTTKLTKEEVEQHNSLAKELDNLRESLKDLAIKNDDARADWMLSIASTIAKLKTNKAKDKDGNVIIDIATVNYFNLLDKLLEPDYLNNLFKHRSLAPIRNIYKETIEADEFTLTPTDDDIIETDDTPDGTTQSWNREIKSTDNLYDDFLKVYFTTIPKLVEKVDENTENYNYDRNNQVGVPMYMDPTTVMKVITDLVDGNSIEDFINSIKRLSQQIPDCYGFYKIYKDCSSNYEFANRLFASVVNQKIDKTLIIIDKHGINVNQSNKNIDSFNNVMNSILNTSRATMFDLYDPKDATELTEILNEDLSKSAFSEKREKETKQLRTKIYNILKKYYSTITYYEIDGYLNNVEDGNTLRQNYRALTQDIINLVRQVRQVIDSYENTKSEQHKAYLNWIKEKEEYEFANPTSVFYKPKPTIQFDNINYDALNQPAIELAKKLSLYKVGKNDLVSINAEGHTSADLLPNTWISNLMKQINYGTKEQSQKGLELLLKEVQKTHQYDYSPLFFGIDGVDGKHIDGLFIKNNDGSYKVNPDAKRLIQISLFNGVKDDETMNGLSYAKMAKGDYFISDLLCFLNPQKTQGNISTPQRTLNDNFAGYLMRTPSDAPKNFILQTRKYNTEGVVTADAESSRQYLKNRYDQLAQLTNLNNLELSPNTIFKNRRSFERNNVKSAKDIYDIIFENVDNINITYLWNGEENGNVYVPLVYKKENSNNYLTVWIKGNVVVNGSQRILINPKVAKIEDTSDSFDSYNNFKEDLKSIIIQEGLNNKQIKTIINRNTDIFSVFRQQLLNELSCFVSQLQNVFEYNNGNWTLKTDTTNVFENAHYNSIGYNLEKGEYVKAKGFVEGDYIKQGNEYIKNPRAGKLSGNFFQFIKLFETNGFDAQELIESTLSLYGGVSEGEAEGLIQRKNGTLTLNTKHFLFNGDRNQITLSNSQELTEILNNIVEKWISEYINEIDNRSQQYTKLLEDNNISRTQVIDWALNTANSYMSFDDVFEGDVKFYPNARGFLKRAKEIQMGGKAYAGFDFNDPLSESIKDVVIKDKPIPITVAGVNINEFTNSYPVEGTIVHNASNNARNGFRAITIYNTVRPSKYKTQIRQELENILSKEFSSEEAAKRAFKISEPYFDKTKTNDAQSYITLEEFIRRRWADGTLNLYQDILQQIYDARKNGTKLDMIDLININARIQLEKNVYFDQKFDIKTQTRYPRQIKNAEFVLIPDFLEGTELKQLYDIMIRYDIGQINTAETSKAAKKTILTFWDNDGNINPNFEQDLVLNGENAIEDFYYRYLYKQQEVPQHMQDATNKAGIQVLKKVLDNPNEENRPLIKQFMQSYCANIKESFQQMVYNMGWKINEDGSIININNENEPLDFNEFYERAQEEALRLGLDENFMDYITPNEFGDPRMPNFMNNVSIKLESIANAMFNSAITRQKLPGWHAAQVTQIGHGEKVLDSNGKLKELKYHPTTYSNKEGNKISQEEYDKSSDEDKANYEVKQEAYAEVLIPRWSNLIPKDYPIKKLEQEGLDIQISYRIPTEGKQSVSIVKVVGFLDDVYGSTVMLPDEWVTQTGADFDIDSVYAITYEMYFDKNTKTLKKYKSQDYITKDKQTGEDILKNSKRLYQQYIMDFVEDRITDVDNEKNNKLKNALKEIKSHINKAELARTKFNKVTKELKVEDEAYKTAKKEFDEINDNVYKEINKLGESLGLLSYNAWNKQTLIEKLPRKVRNNMILDSMVKIMEHPSSREENYSSSNFKSISMAKAECEEALGLTVKSTSAYNPFDQIDFQYDAMSGASLKAQSVNRDTFNSVNNTCQTYLPDNRGIVVKYSIEDGYNLEQIKSSYSGDIIKETEDYVIVKHKRLANSKNGNRNVVGELITAYSSQTTAHILDAIKEGAIYNENDYTFGTFKTLIDLGIDYKTAIAYLMQPGISEIVNANNESNSIYIRSKNNPVNVAIKEIARKAGYTINGAPINEFSNVNDLLDSLYNNLSFGNVVEKLFSAQYEIGKEFNVQTIALNKKELINRLNRFKINNNSASSNAEERFEDMVFDIVICLTFDNYNKTTKQLEKVRQCTNPDKFGAKQTVRMNRNIITFIDNNYEISKTYTSKDADINRKIKEHEDYLTHVMGLKSSERFKELKKFIDENGIKDYYETFTNNPGNILLCNIENGNNPFVGTLFQALYPGFDNNHNIDIEQSKYPYLAAFLKYSTIPAINIGSTLFATENDKMNKILNQVQHSLGVVFTDEQYKEYKQYMISQVYANVPFLYTPTTLTEQGYIIIDKDRMTEAGQNDTNYWNVEVSRVFGYETNETIGFQPEKDENDSKAVVRNIKRFNKLTPAQKVIWIQKNYPDDCGIFKYMKVNLFNQFEIKHKGYSNQSIKFEEGVVEPNITYSEFNKTFFNKNPYFRLAAIDLIKYAFIVEGFKFKKGSISKCIDNECMYGRIEDMGMNLIDMINKAFYDLQNPEENMQDKAIDRFIRSHHDMVHTIELKKPNKRIKEDVSTQFLKVDESQNGLKYIPLTDTYKQLLEKLTIDDVTKPKNYIKIISKIGNDRISTLYKIRKTDAGYYLIPLNLLERNETQNYSVNNDNNKYFNIDYYNAIIKVAEEKHTTVKQLMSKTLDEEWLDLKKDNTIPRFTHKQVNSLLENIDEIQRLSVYGNSVEQLQFSHFIDQIKEANAKLNHIEGINEVIIRNESTVLRNLISKGVDVYQKINIDGQDITFKISKRKLSDRFSEVIKNAITKNDRYKLPFEQLLLGNLPVGEQYRMMYDSLKEYYVANPSLYGVSIAEDQNTQTAIQEIQDNVEEDRLTERFSLIGNVYSTETDAEGKTILNKDLFSEADQISKNMLVSLRRAELNGDKRASEARRSILRNGVYEHKDSTIIDNRYGIYTQMAEYLDIYSKSTLFNLEHYVFNGDEELSISYSLGDPKFYEELLKHPEEVNKVINLLLDAATFGKQYGDILNLNLEGVDTKTNEVLNKIKHHIQSVRNNTNTKQGFKHIFDIYLANKYSTNPLVRKQIITLKETFGDLGWWETNIGDIGHVTNKQIQAVVKAVNSIMYTASTIDAPAARREFEAKFDEIVKNARSGEVDINKLINNQGALIKPYTEDFVTLYEFHVKNLDEIRERNGGEDNLEYIQAKLAKDKFMAKNTHQVAKQNYYDTKNQLLEDVLGVAPDLLVKYIRLRNEKYSINRPIGILSKDERDRLNAITEQIKYLTSEWRDDQTKKSSEECIKANALKDYIDAIHRLNNEFFEYKEAALFKETLDEHLKVIHNYDKAHPHDSLDEKLSDFNYRNSYDWIKQNTIYKIDEDTQKTLDKAFKVLKDGKNGVSKDIKQIMIDADAFDAFGDYDPSKLSDKDLAKIKDIQSGRYRLTYDSPSGNAVLIRDVPGDLPILTNSFYDSLRDESERDETVNRERLDTIAKINAILEKIIVRETNTETGKIEGKIYAKDVFNDSKLTDAEREELADLYYKLHNIKSKRKSKELIEKYKENVEFKVNQEAFDKNLNWAENNLTSKQFNLFLSIFGTIDKNGEFVKNENTGEYIPNNELYGYIIPKDDKYIDTNKTEARKLINSNLEFIPIEKYFIEQAKHKEDGTYKEWFEKNHVFNPYTHKFEPLRIWTTMRLKPDGSLKGKYEYIATFDNKERYIKKGKEDAEYKPGRINYNRSTGDYNSNINLTNKEQELLLLLEKTMDFFSQSKNNSKKFIEDRFIPRKYEDAVDTQWVIEQGLHAVGLHMPNDTDTQYHQKVDYTNFHEVDNDMLAHLKVKGQKTEIPIRPKEENESDIDYKNYLEETRRKNKEIKEYNNKLEFAHMNKDYKTLFAEAIETQVVANARAMSRDWLYLLQEDLKSTEVPIINEQTKNLIRRRKYSTDNNTVYQTESQNNALKIVEGYTRRIVYEQYKKPHRFNKYARLMQNITSAKYMIFNITGGVANVGTGFANIMGEAFGSDSFNKKDLDNAVKTYLTSALNTYFGNIHHFVAELYSDKSDNKYSAIIKFFDIVDLDAMTERKIGEKAGEYARRMQDALYSLQSMGEHFMQNTALFALLESTRIFRDIDGDIRCGTFQEYVWDLEEQSLLDVIRTNENLYNTFKNYMNDIKGDKKQLFKYDTLKLDYIENFLRKYCNSEIRNKYAKIRKDKYKQAKIEWNNYENTRIIGKLIDHLDHKDGYIIPTASENVSIEDLKEIIAQFKNRAIYVNNQIHGVYNKLGAAQIEFNWFGGLVMQYHKHLYPGFMKRIRSKGYYNEQTNDRQIGSYVALAHALLKPFDNYSERLAKAKETGKSSVYANLYTILESLSDYKNIKEYWSIMPQWEKNALKRVKGDIFGILAAMFLGISIYALTDDDDEKESDTIAGLIYIADRLINESQLYTPWGVVSEAKTMWSSPIATMGTIEDIAKATTLITRYMFDDDFNTVYDRGIYKGENKLSVLVQDNIPLWRNIRRWNHMTKSNSYYRINEKSLNVGLMKDIGNYIQGE